MILGGNIRYLDAFCDSGRGLSEDVQQAVLDLYKARGNQDIGALVSQSQPQPPQMQAKSAITSRILLNLEALLDSQHDAILRYRSAVSLGLQKYANKMMGASHILGDAVACDEGALESSMDRSDSSSMLGV